MNTTRKTETVVLCRIIAFPGAISFLAIALLGAVTVCFAQTPSPTTSAIATPNAPIQMNASATGGAETEPAREKIPADQLDLLVGPIALYPDSLLVQALAASTYPLEVIQLKQWLDKNKKLKDKALADAVAQQNWDPSVQAMAAFPGVVQKLANDIQWTTDLGNAFLAQESDLMDAVQRLRTKAQANGSLKTNDKQKVANEASNDGKQAITIEPAQREVVYVPTYNTQVVYRDSNSSSYSGYSDSSSYSGYSGSSSYSDDGYSYVGYAAGAAYSAAYGYYNWRDRHAEVNYNNYYTKNYNAKWNNKVNNWSSNNNGNNWSNKANNWAANNSGNSWNGSGKGNEYSQRATEGAGRWQHDPSHRGNTPYGNRNLSERFGQGNSRLSNSGLTNQASSLAKGNAGNQLARANLSRAGARPDPRPANAGAANRIGNRMPTNFPNSARGGAFAAPKGDFARAASARGAQSLTAPGGFRGGPPGGLRAGGPPMGGGPPIGGGLPMGGAPPAPPPAPPIP